MANVRHLQAFVAKRKIAGELETAAVPETKQKTKITPKQEKKITETVFTPNRSKGNLRFPDFADKLEVTWMSATFQHSHHQAADRNAYRLSG